MSAMGGGEVLPQQEAAPAAGAVELRFYLLRDKDIKSMGMGIKSMGVLELCDPMPPPPPQVDAGTEATFIDRDVEISQNEAGMYVALFKGGSAHGCRTPLLPPGAARSGGCTLGGRADTGGQGRR